MVLIQHSYISLWYLAIYVFLASRHSRGQSINLVDLSRTCPGLVPGFWRRATARKYHFMFLHSPNCTSYNIMISRFAATNIFHHFSIFLKTFIFPGTQEIETDFVGAPSSHKRSSHRNNPTAGRGEGGSFL